MSISKLMEDTGVSQLSLTDADARLMRIRMVSQLRISTDGSSSCNPSDQGF